MIIDSRVHVGTSLFRKSLNLKDLLTMMKENNVDGAVLVPFKPPRYHFEGENTEISRMVKENPDKFRGFGRVDPWQGEKAVEEAVRIFEQLNLSGLFIDPLEENCPLTSEILTPLLDFVKKYNKPVMIAGGHVRVSHPRQVEFIAAKHRDLTFIVTSGGQINICGELLWDAEEMLKNSPNVIMETSGVYRRDFIEQMTGIIGPERVLFGSGVPYYNQGFEIQRIRTAHIPEEEKEKVLGRNAETLFWN